MLNSIIMVCLYLVPLIFIMNLISMLWALLTPNRLSVLTQLRHYMDHRRNDYVKAYQRPSMSKQFEEAGLIVMGITPMHFRIYRDVVFLIWFVLLHYRYVMNMDQGYPSVGLFILVIAYILLQLRESFPMKWVLLSLKKRYEARKDAEIYVLQQLISNEYADKHTSKQNIYHLFMYLRNFTHHIRPAIDCFLEQYPQDPHNKEKAFGSFARLVGTKEGEALALILYQVDQSSPEEVHELLTKRYEELKKKRQETYRRAMNDRGVIAYVLTFSGVMMVIICGLFVYYLEYKDMMNATYNMNG